MANKIIYLDNCCFNRPYDDQSSTIVHIETEAKLDIQTFVKEGKLDLAWSFMLDYENSQNPFTIRKIEIQLWESIASFHQEAMESIRDRAREIIELYNFDIKDAIHLACATHLQCHWFITTDKQMLKKRVDFNFEVMNPIDFIRIYGEEFYDKN
jgi:predicted nucleic acid-binding protein